MDNIQSNYYIQNVNIFKLQIYLIASNTREYHYFDYPCIINDETQDLMNKHNLIIYNVDLSDNTLFHI